MHTYEYPSLLFGYIFGAFLLIYHFRMIFLTMWMADQILHMAEQNY